MDSAAPLSGSVARAAHRLAVEFTAEHPAADARDFAPEQAQHLVADIAARLRGVCAHLDDEAFAALVYDIARVRLRDELHARGVRAAPAVRPPAGGPAAEGTG